MKTQFFWDEEQGMSRCEIEYHKQTFVGIAFCHQDDADMQSERVGRTISEARAVLQLYKYIRDCEISPSTRAIAHLYNTMKKNDKFNPESFEAKFILKNKIASEKELKTIRFLIKETKNNLNTYIQDKEAFYQKVQKKQKEMGNLK